MAGKKKTGRQDDGKFANDDYDEEKDSYKDSDDEWKPKTGGNEEEEEEDDEDDEDDDGPKLVCQPRSNNKLDLMEKYKYYEQKIRHLQ